MCISACAPENGRHRLSLDKPAPMKSDLLRALEEATQEKPKGLFRRDGQEIKGVSEETTHRRASPCTTCRRPGTLLCGAIQRHDSVTKSKFDNLLWCVITGRRIRRGTDVMMSGKWPWSPASATSAKARPLRCARRPPRDGLRSRSDLRAAGGDGRLSGRHHGRRRAAGRHLRHRTGNKDIITIEHNAAMGIKIAAVGSGVAPRVA